MKIEKIRGGIVGKILRVDLTSGKMVTEDTEKYASRFISGRAINSLILLNEMNPKTKWSDPENIIIFGVGCLVGTITPAACRVSIDTKNVYSNGKGSANFGGHFGPEIKYAGFDNIIVTGKSPKPVYLLIHDGGAEIKDASSLWGKMTYDTEAILRRELRDPHVQVASIGPAGENLVKGAIVFTNPGKAAGGSGVGCVMGDKKLKAIAVRGRGTVKVAEPQRFMKSVDLAFSKIEQSPFSKRFRRGILEAVHLPEDEGWDFWSSPRNGQDEYWPMEKRRRLADLHAGIPKYKKRVLSCFSCPIGCMPFFNINTGKYSGTKGIGYWINSATYSTKLDLDDPDASLRYHIMLNQLGLDGDMCSVSLAWAFECFEKGLLTKNDTDGLQLRWGDGEAILKMQKKLAYREGLGDFLANGVEESARNLGKGSEEFATHMKGQDSVDTYRILKAWGFGVATSPVAGRHLRGSLSVPGRGGPEGLSWNPFDYENIADAVFWEIQAKEIEDMVGLCNFIGTYGPVHPLKISDYVQLVNSAMGTNLSQDELMLIARRGVNLEKAFNTIHTDIGRKDDYPPRRYMEEPVKSGPYAGQKCDKDKWDEMLDRYYELQGWDKQTGLQTRQGLVDLGEMEDVIWKLQEAGRLY
jgi:aldehyde:ferredoxin oxidoreductase